MNDLSHRLSVAPMMDRNDSFCNINRLRGLARRQTMNFRRYFLLFFAAALSLGGCVVYEPVALVAPQQTTAQRFDRSWSAALGAMSDQGLTITSQDYGAGVITGRQDAVMIS